MPNWTRRAITVLVGIPLALNILQSEFGAFILLAALQFFSLLEYKQTICRAIVRRFHGRPQKKKETFEAGFQNGEYSIPIAGLLLSFSAYMGRETFYLAFSFTIFALILMYILQFDDGEVSQSPKSRRIVRGGTQGDTLRQTGSSEALHEHSTDAALAAILSLGLELFGLCYIVWGFSCAILLRSLPKHGLGYQVLTALCMWNTDNGAILLGSALGGRKFMPEVSPGKTVAGVAGGLGLSVLTACGMRSALSLELLGNDFLPELPMISYAIYGFVLGIFAIFGDLAESLVKRVAGVKDSGKFFPGHGGCLDRMDSLLFAAPFTYYLLNTLMDMNHV